MAGRVCAHGPCGKPAKTNGKYCSPACRTAAWKVRSGYVKPAARDARETPHRRRTGGPRGADMPWRRSVATLTAGLLELDRLPSTFAEAAEMAERLLAPALSEKQAARVGLTTTLVAGREAPPRRRRDRETDRQDAQRDPQGGVGGWRVGV